jgi:hypothetical protein
MDDADADPMAAAVEAAPRGFQDIRALPVRAGGAVFFTHRVIHWGSASRAGYPTPRIACSWAATADDYEKPYFSRYESRNYAHVNVESLCEPMLMAFLVSAGSTCPSRLRHYVRAYVPGSSSTTTSASDRASTDLTFTTECLTLLPQSLTRITRPRCKGSISGLNLRWLGACKLLQLCASSRLHYRKIIPVCGGRLWRFMLVHSPGHTTHSFVADREKAPAQRKSKKRMDGDPKTNATAEEQGSSEIAAPLDLEEELQGMFGAVALGDAEAEAQEGDDDFEESYWNGTEWVDGPPPPGQQ